MDGELKMINLNDIEVSFVHKSKVTNAINKVNLSVKKGEIFGIVGYSGAGKSTLIRVINLLQKPNSGSVLVNGVELLSLSAQALRSARQKIGMIFQHFNLMNARTVRENVLYPLRHSGLSKIDKNQKVLALLKLVGLEDKLDAYPAQLSGGQKQRVAIARALANDPQILLCDEATSALDPKTTLAILKLLKELNQSLGVTIVLITHEMQVVQQICNKVAIMDKGNIIEQGEVINVFRQPQQALTQDFIRIATHEEQAYAAILQHPPLSSLADNESLFELKYAQNSTLTPFISRLTQQFAVLITVIYSYTDIIENQPVGYLIVKIQGDEWQVENAIQALHQQHIMVNRLNILQDSNYYLI